MFRPQKKTSELKQGDKFAFDANGKSYEVLLKSPYKMLVKNEAGDIFPFHYFIYLKSIFIC